MAKLSIIIVTYNSSKHIYDCLDSLFKYNNIGEELEVIVVDNASTEQSVMFKNISERYGDAVILRDSGKNGGYGFGNNIGILQSTSNLIIVMNPDVRIVKPIFGQILNQMKDETVGMLGVSFVDGSLPFYIKPEYVNYWNQLIHPLLVKLKMYNERRMYMSGSFLVFRKDSFLKAGMFDEKIFMYTEEPDITNRIQKLQYHAVWCPEIQVKHLAHGRAFNIKTEDMTCESLKYYFNKYDANLINNIRVKIRILRLKRFVARLFDKMKYDLFDKRLLYFENFIKTLR